MHIYDDKNIYATDGNRTGFDNSKGGDVNHYTTIA